MARKVLSLLRCLSCLKKRKFSRLRVSKREGLVKCNECGEVYPLYKDIPVVLSDAGDFHHLRKALLPIKYRIKGKI
jgi:uncharacterized protein YbaR (Trm112 family)